MTRNEESEPLLWLLDLKPEELALLTPEEATERKRLTDIRRPTWEPFPGTPQEQGYYSLADELFYGGSAGGGKTALLLGLAGTAHWRSVIFRREFPQTRAMIEDSRTIYNARGLTHSKDSYNESTHIWRLLSGRLIEFASMEHEKDKENQRGRDRDFFGWDELPQFTESQFRFANAWNRSTRPGQRCRIVATGNPPTSAEGEWVIRYWGPWLDSQHPNPARPGELRWFARLDDRDVEVEGPALIQHKSETIRPRSRSFIPARLSDNPILSATNYGAILQSMPEPLRSQMLYGDFTIGVADDAWQCIPTAWVRAAQARWTPTPPAGQGLTCLGVDVAHGGADSTVPAPRYGPWFARPKKYQGAITDSGKKAAYLVLQDYPTGCGARVQVDGIGYGASCAEALKDKLGPLVEAINVSQAPDPPRFDRSKKYKLVNIRAAMFWALREALDPETGDNLALPPDQELLGDLCAARFEVRASGIVLEDKESIKKRIGRSPDVGEAIALAHWRSSMLRPFTMGTSQHTTAGMEAPEGVFASDSPGSHR